MSQDPKQERLLDEEHDGIQEYDNPTPRWWIWLFVATFVFAVLYGVNVPGIGSGKGRIASYEDEVTRARERFPAAVAAPASSDAELVALAADAARLEQGGTLFATHCAACHRADGGGVIGPNLTDDHWIHGARPSRILATIQAGVADKGMPAWGTVLKPADLPLVTAWVLHLHGTAPKDPKAPQGSLETWEGGAVAQD